MSEREVMRWMTNFQKRYGCLPTRLRISRDVLVEWYMFGDITAQGLDVLCEALEHNRPFTLCGVAAEAK